MLAGYKTMYQNTDIKLEENSITSRNLSGTLSKITEEYHKIQQLLQTKNGLEVDLGESRKEVENVRSLISTANEWFAEKLHDRAGFDKSVLDFEDRKNDLESRLEIS